MRRQQKQEILKIINTLFQAHIEIKDNIKPENNGTVQNMLCECQDCAISLGEVIEEIEGEGCSTIAFLEGYCETLFCVNEKVASGVYDQIKLYQLLEESLFKVEKSVKNDIKERIEIVFFPYKASMWDSLESVYFAAKEDSNCDVYCVPIPYFDIGKGDKPSKINYEGDKFPPDIDITDWRNYSFEERRPDVIYIHNPYDDWNLVTSVHPRYYSANLKKYTEMLVYVPYYTTSGGMSDGQRLCPAYINADYIVTQAPKYRSYFDDRIPDEKFLPLGSPKFDKVISKCQNPPVPSKAWREKMAGKKVYFFNTSLNGMLRDTAAFLKKLQYVFRCFESRDNACLVWRPHPLMESTLDAMRPQFKPEYEKIKNDFINSDVGLYDTTPDITDTIAVCDAYIGCTGSSVISLFGIVGKPIFILNNYIVAEPGETDWEGEIKLGFNMYEEDWSAIVTQGNKLYIFNEQESRYKYCCDLSTYSYGQYYLNTYKIKDKRYICPINAQDILVVGDQGVEKKIELKKYIEKDGAFYWSWRYEEYLLLLPLKYPALVRYNTSSNKVDYYEENIEIFVRDDRGVKKGGGSCIYQGKLYIASPVDNKIYIFDIKSGKIEVLNIQTSGNYGCLKIVENNGVLWLLPNVGKVIVRWNPNTHEVKEYTDFPDDFCCMDPIHHSKCEERPFGIPAFQGDYVFFPPAWGNMFIRLNINTGEMVRWVPPIIEKEPSGYYFIDGKYSFLAQQKRYGEYCRLFTFGDRKLYNINLETNKCIEVDLNFDIKELKKQNSGFGEYSGWLGYCCLENAFWSLPDFIDGVNKGTEFDKAKQLQVYQDIASNYDGSCGLKVHKYIMGKLEKE